MEECSLSEEEEFKLQNYVKENDFKAHPLAEKPSTIS